jgi:hypothetical protein
MVDVTTTRACDRGQLPHEARKPRTWRTWPDALTDVWPVVAEQLQKEARLQTKTLWHLVQQMQPGKYPESMRRTFERRVRQWKALHGPAKEVFFSQVHEPGWLGASDFTHLDILGATIQGHPFPHLVNHFVLTYSNWEHATLCLSKSFASLSAGRSCFLRVQATRDQETRHNTESPPPLCCTDLWDDRRSEKLLITSHGYSDR